MSFVVYDGVPSYARNISSEFSGLKLVTVFRIRSRNGASNCYGVFMRLYVLTGCSRSLSASYSTAVSVELEIEIVRTDSQSLRWFWLMPVLRRSRSRVITGEACSMGVLRSSGSMGEVGSLFGDVCVSRMLRDRREV